MSKRPKRECTTENKPPNKVMGGEASKDVVTGDSYDDPIAPVAGSPVINDTKGAIGAAVDGGIMMDKSILEGNPPAKDGAAVDVISNPPGKGGAAADGATVEKSCIIHNTPMKDGAEADGATVENSCTIGNTPVKDGAAADGATVDKSDVVYNPPANDGEAADGAAVDIVGNPPGEGGAAGVKHNAAVNAIIDGKTAVRQLNEIAIGSNKMLASRSAEEIHWLM